MNKRAPMREPEPKNPPQREPSNTPPSKKEPPTDEPPREEPDDSGSPMKVGRGHGDGCSIAYRLTNTCLKITIEADGRIGIVLNLASMTAPNLIDDLPKMSDATQLECVGSSYAAYSWCDPSNHSCTWSRKDSIVPHTAKANC
jgi:hypothetical protein